MKSQLDRMQRENNNLFLRVFDRLSAHYGQQNWWPGETALEIMVGAVLTQNTNWGNVEKAIANLKDGDRLSFSGIQSMDVSMLAEYIRPAGYYNVKARRLKNLLQMIVDCYEGELSFLFEDSLEESRKNLLKVNGVGPETADSILLYAARKPVFVIDTYTHRIFSRHQLVDENADYDSLQQAFLDKLPEDEALFNEYHALIVTVAKEFCKKKKPRCTNCPLQRVEEN